MAGFGVVYGSFSSDLSDAQQREQQLDPTVGVQDYETVFEWTYRFNLRKGALFIQPDIQYIKIRAVRDKSTMPWSLAARLDLISNGIQAIFIQVVELIESARHTGHFL